ncbi:Hypothetical protein PFCIRM125_03055 [Propionibacterium freudenreichii]|nr:Hypothetical protein PFCIRM125_03055 [Propionibacterium freudenreichii]
MESNQNGVHQRKRLNEGPLQKEGQSRAAGDDRLRERASMKGPSRRRGNTFVSELNAIAAAPQ